MSETGTAPIDPTMVQTEPAQPILETPKAPKTPKAPIKVERRFENGTELTYLGGSRSDRLRKGQVIKVAGSASNKNGTWRYNVRAKNGKGESFTTWLAGRYIGKA